MPSRKQISNHPAFTYAAELKAICEPLHLLDIAYFSHVRVDSSHRVAGLGLEPKFVKLYIEKKYYNFDIHMLKFTQPEQFILWDAIDIDKESKQMDDDFQHLGMGHTFSIIQNHGKHVDCYHFGAKRGFTGINQRYLQNIDLLKKFINYFNHKVMTSKELSEAYNIKFAIDTTHGGYFTKNDLCDAIYNEFINKITTDRFYLENNRYLTLREFHCLYWLSQGKTFLEIAIILSISERTVKFHIQSIKEKFSCDTLFQLGILFEKLKLSNRMIPRDLLREPTLSSTGSERV